MRKALIGLILVATSFGCGNASKPKAQPATPPATFVLTGAVEVRGYGQYQPTLDDGCAGAGPYGGVASGAQVTVTDNVGATVAIAALGSGELIREDLVGNGTTRMAGCRLTFQAANVPAGKGFYGVKVVGLDPTQVPEAQARQVVIIKFGENATIG